MIFLDKIDGTSEHLTEEEMKAKYPALWARTHQPRPHQAQGEALRQKRIEKRVVLREMGRRLGMRISEICDYEMGRKDPGEIEVRYLECLTCRQ